MGVRAQTWWESVLRDFPDSNYVPYAILMTRYLAKGSRDELARNLLTIERFPILQFSIRSA